MLRGKFINGVASGSFDGQTEVWSINVTTAFPNGLLEIVDTRTGLVMIDLDTSQVGSYWFGLLFPAGCSWSLDSAAIITIGYR